MKKYPRYEKERLVAVKAGMDTSFNTSKKFHATSNSEIAFPQQYKKWFETIVSGQSN